MVKSIYETEKSYEQRNHERMLVLYAREMHERKIMMKELTVMREAQSKNRIKWLAKVTGPIWYQVLSDVQRNTLDTLKNCIEQDLYEGRPLRTISVIKCLGLIPMPNVSDLMTCMILGRDDEKEMMAQLFICYFGYGIESRFFVYNLNARLILSSIFYLGLAHILKSLREIFGPDRIEKKSRRKPIPKLKQEEEKPVSPYLQKMVALRSDKPKGKQYRIAPLPNLDELNNDIYDFDDPPPVSRKKPPVPPPPPPKKKTLPKEFCDEIAGIMRIEPYSPVTAVASRKSTKGRKKNKNAKLLTDLKKTSGGMQGKRKKPPIPSTGVDKTKYIICGVFTVKEKIVYVLGNVAQLPPDGELIHGGFVAMGEDNVNVHCGYKPFPPPPVCKPCDCIEKYNDRIFDYVKNSKCYCGHYYDYGNEGTFPPQELPFFEKPTRYSPYRFNYDTIFDVDEKSNVVNKEFKRIWDTDSMLKVEDPNKKKGKKKKKTGSKTCLGDNPKPSDYLKCALRTLRQVNHAARLPDVHLVPELLEWMRRRIQGTLTRDQRNEYLNLSRKYWSMFEVLELLGFGHVDPPRIANSRTNWLQKQKLTDESWNYIHKYRVSLFKSYAKVTNMLWATMYQPQFPDKKFRQIFFSYLSPRLEDINLMHPYTSAEAVERRVKMTKKRVICLPAGVYPKTENK